MEVEHTLNLFEVSDNVEQMIFRLTGGHVKMNKIPMTTLYEMKAAEAC